MTASLRILGIDPGINEAAAALLTWDDKRPNLGGLAGTWRIRPEGKTLPERLLSLADQIGALIEDQDPTVILVEMPADQARGRGRQGFSARSVLTLPIYGAAVGAAVVAALQGGKSGTTAGADGTLRMFFPSSSDWTGRDIPSSRGDDYKLARVAFVSQLYRITPESLGPKSAAGNVADAVLIARWGLWRATA